MQSRVVLSLLLSQQGVPLYDLSGSKVVPYARCDREGAWRGKHAPVFLRLDHFFSLGCSPRSSLVWSEGSFLFPPLIQLQPQHPEAKDLGLRGERWGTCVWMSPSPRRDECVGLASLLPLKGIIIFKGQAELEEGSFHQKSMADDFDRVKVLVAQSCLTLCDPMVCSPPGFSVNGILQARKLEWVALPFSRGSS